MTTVLRLNRTELTRGFRHPRPVNYGYDRMVSGEETETAGSKPDPWRTPARRALGRLLLDGPLGAYRLAKRAGLDPSNAHRTLESLQSDGGVEIEVDTKPRQWRLAPDQRGVLEQTLAAEQPEGRLVRGQRVLRVSTEPSGEAALAHALRGATTTAALAWAARVEGAEAQYLLVVDRDATSAEVAAVVQHLLGAGAIVGRMVVEDVFSPEAFRGLLAATRDVVADSG